MKIKKCLSLLLVAVTFMGIFAHNSNALPQYLEYWYAYYYNTVTGLFTDAYIIRYFDLGPMNDKYPVMYKENLSGFSNTSFNSYFTHGRNQWFNAGFISSYAYTEENANFKVYGGNNVDVKVKVPSLSAAIPARTVPTSTSVGTISCAVSTTKEVEKISEVKIGINYSTYSDNVYKNIFTHEMGHGFGWDNHSNNDADVMWPQTSYNTVLTNRDINHIKQMYQ